MATFRLGVSEIYLQKGPRGRLGHRKGRFRTEPSVDLCTEPVEDTVRITANPSRAENSEENRPKMARTPSRAKETEYPTFFPRLPHTLAMQDAVRIYTNPSRAEDSGNPSRAEVTEYFTVFLPVSPLHSGNIAER